VTLLAAANGAQDLATSTVAAFAEDASDIFRNPIYLSMGALIGAAAGINMVITSVVTIQGTKSSTIKVILATNLLDAMVVLLEGCIVLAVDFGVDYSVQCAWKDRCLDGIVIPYTLYSLCGRYIGLGYSTNS
jgi:Ca2+/Na+ antiporter